jgi:putative PEP-CTERM system integral membrane protein
LRAFPVEPRIATYDDKTNRLTTSEGKPMYLWLTFQVMADQEAWPMPQLAVARNVYWDDKTVRLINGNKMKVESRAWLPSHAPASGPVTAIAHQVDLGMGESILVVPEAQVRIPNLPENLRLAVVLDRSRSMVAHSNQVAQALEDLRRIGEAGARVDLYQTASAYRGEGPVRTSLSDVDEQAIEYIGGQNPAELLAQYDQLRAGKKYDAVLVLTDGSGYELGPSSAQAPSTEAPIWMIHLERDLPLGYDDQTLEAIQASGGGVASSLDEALMRMILARTHQAGNIVSQDLVDGYLWSLAPTQEIDPGEFQVHSAEDGFTALAARRLILAEMQRQRGDLQDLETLDRLHALAIGNSIVTPYSSMIVLVNARQEQQLKLEAMQKDRYEREVEAVGETTPPSPPPLTGVPEPEEWLLIGVAVALLAWYTLSQRAARGG